MAAVYCLDKDGKGSTVFELYDKDGVLYDTCRGDAVAERSGDTITIVNSGPVCSPENGKFSVDTLSCRKDSSDRTSCRVENVLTRRNQDVPYYSTKFTYLGKQDPS